MNKPRIWVASVFNKGNGTRRVDFDRPRFGGFLNNYWGHISIELDAENNVVQSVFGGEVTATLKDIALAFEESAQ